MSYSISDFVAAKKLFEIEIERWVVPFNCSYCGYDGVFGHRNKGDSVLMHPDCFQLDIYDKTDQTPLDMIMNIGQKETPKVYFDKKIMK